MDNLLGSLLVLLIMLIGLSVIVLGPKGPSKIFGFLLAPFGCLLKLAFGLLVLVVLGMILMQSMPDVRQIFYNLIKKAGTQGPQIPPPVEPPSNKRDSLAWPLPAGNKTINQRFGELWSENAAKRHTGIDIDASEGTDVYAVKDGVISKKGSLMDGSRRSADWGYYLIVAHDNGGWTTAYLHISPISTLEVGTSVRQGELVGRVFHDHLHFGIRATGTDMISPRGALPSILDASGDPAFPEKFVDPTARQYRANR